MLCHLYVSVAACAMQHCPRAPFSNTDLRNNCKQTCRFAASRCKPASEAVYWVQAVHMLHEEVGSLSEGSCGDMLVLPIYAALPPELQVCYTLPSSSHMCLSYAPVKCSSCMQLSYAMFICYRIVWNALM